LRLFIGANARNQKDFATKDAEDAKKKKIFQNQLSIIISTTKYAN